MLKLKVNTGLSMWQLVKKLFKTKYMHSNFEFDDKFYWIELNILKKEEVHDCKV